MDTKFLASIACPLATDDQLSQSFPEDKIMKADSSGAPNKIFMDSAFHLRLPWEPRISSETEYIRADIARELAVALEFAESRIRQPDEGHTEFYERLATEFFHRYLHFPPGKDDPLRAVDLEEARKTWESFLDEPLKIRRAALAKWREATEEQDD